MPQFMMSLMSMVKMIVSCFRVKDEKLKFAELNSMTFQSLHVTQNSLLFLIMHENRVAVNRKIFSLAKRKSASLTITEKA